MNQVQLNRANQLWDSGRLVEAAHEFELMAEEATYPDEKAATLANAHTCYCQAGELSKAQEVMRDIRRLDVQDPFVRMIIDIGDAGMLALINKNQEALDLFEKVLELNQKSLHEYGCRHLYEDIQQRRGFALTKLKRYEKAIPILKEAQSFDVAPQDSQLVQLFLGDCYVGTSQTDSAKDAYLLAIKIGLHNAREADAHYRVAVLYFKKRAFGQAKHHLEAALQMPGEVLSWELRKFIYQQLSRTCHYLGEREEEEKYLKLAQEIPTHL